MSLSRPCPRGAISPLLLNIALHELEEAAGVAHQVRRRRVSVLPNQAAGRTGQGEATAWLAPRGLAFNEAKNRIVRLDHGFEFLGFHLRRYPNGKLLIKPSGTAIKRFRKRLATEFHTLRGANVAAVLAKINPTVRGWVAY